MEKKYVQTIVDNRNNLALHIEDNNAHQEIENIKTYLNNATHYLGQSSTEITENFIGKWTINGKDYSGEYLVLSRNWPGYPQISYVRDKSINKGYKSDDDDVRMIGLRMVNYMQQFPDIIYTIGSNLSNLDINNIFINENNNWIPIENLISNIYLDTYVSPINQDALELNNGDISIFDNEKFMWSPVGWIGSNSKNSKIIFPSMEFEPLSGELVITDEEDIEDNFDFDYTTGELIFNP